MCDGAPAHFVPQVGHRQFSPAGHFPHCKPWDYKQIPVPYTCHVAVVNLVVRWLKMLKCFCWFAFEGCHSGAAVRPKQEGQRFVTVRQPEQSSHRFQALCALLLLQSNAGAAFHQLHVITVRLWSCEKSGLNKANSWTALIPPCVAQEAALCCAYLAAGLSSLVPSSSDSTALRRDIKAGCTPVFQ